MRKAHEVDDALYIGEAACCLADGLRRQADAADGDERERLRNAEACARQAAASMYALRQWLEGMG